MPRNPPPSPLHLYGNEEAPPPPRPRTETRPPLTKEGDLYYDEVQETPAVSRDASRDVYYLEEEDGEKEEDVGYEDATDARYIFVSEKAVRTMTTWEKAPDFVANTRSTWI